MSENQNDMDCPSAVKNVFEKLCSWQEESRRQFSEIINSHRDIIRKEQKELKEEMIELKGQLEVIEYERKLLLEEVDNLNGEIKQLNTKLIPVISDQEIIDDEIAYKKPSNKTSQHYDQEIVKNHEAVPKREVQPINIQNNTVNDITRTAWTGDDGHNWNTNYSLERGVLGEKEVEQIDVGGESTEVRITEEEMISLKPV